MVEPTELEGTRVHVTAAGAHWQLGKTEVHGGWFGRVLSKVLESQNPQIREAWLECLVQAHVKNQMIQSYGFTRFTPSQRVFGKHPNMPGDLLNEPQPIVPNTGSLHDDAIARTYAIRTAARKAVLELQDDKTLRRAMLARPRHDKPFVAGDIVAYWRDQTWNQSKGGKWYGSGVVLGLIGRNVVIAHRNHILRCAPEQVRLATSEERALIETQGTELLGIKDMIEGGTFRCSQYVDLISQSYPPKEQEVISDVRKEENNEVQKSLSIRPRCLQK